MTEDYTRTSTQSVAWFRSRADEGSLDKRPPFQRNFVWSRRQQSALIETILLRYPIPELYMQEGLTEAEQESYILVDGQQRVTTCLDYVAGGFALDGNIDSRWARTKFAKLSEVERRRILQYQFVVRTLPADWSEERLRDVFARLNRGVSALEDQELRHATYWGPFIKCMETIAKDERWTELRVFTANDIRRMADVEFISELTVAFMFGPLNKKDDLDDYYVLYEEEFEQEGEVVDRFAKLLPVLTDLSDEMTSRRWRKKSDFYTLFLILASDVERWCAPSIRPALAVLLDEFAEEVDLTLSRLGREVAAVVKGEDAKGDVLRQVPEEVSEYTLAVRGAASDLSARRSRQRALEQWLSARLTRDFVAQAAEHAAIREAAVGPTSSVTKGTSEDATERSTTPKKAAVKKVPAKKVPAKTVPAKKVPAKKVPAKKVPAKKAAAKKMSAKRP